MKSKKLAIIGFALSVCGAVTAVVSGIAAYGNYQMSKIPALSFEDCVQYTTSGNKNAVITVGTIKNGEISWTVYGKDGEILPSELHDYEIGSLTKTITASMIMKCVDEGKISLEAPISDYLELPERAHYPTIKQLLSHTSGYSAYYLESPMVGNFFGGKNSFYGIGDSMVLDRLKKTEVSESEHKFDYSNFGYAALGLILEKVTQTEFITLMNEYLHNELALENTKISDGQGDLGKLWDWQRGILICPRELLCQISRIC